MRAARRDGREKPKGNEAILIILKGPLYNLHSLVGSGKRRESCAASAADVYPLRLRGRFIVTHDISAAGSRVLYILTTGFLGRRRLCGK